MQYRVFRVPVGDPEILPPEQFAVFARLRDVRKRLAEVHGIPVYAVLTNEQFTQPHIKSLF